MRQRAGHECATAILWLGGAEEVERLEVGEGEGVGEGDVGCEG